MSNKSAPAVNGPIVAVGFGLVIVAAWIGAASGGFVPHNFGVGPLGAGNFGGGLGGGGFFNNVGGVSVDADGVVRDVQRQVREDLVKLRAKDKDGRLAAKVPQDFDGKLQLRKFSLRQMQEAIWKVRLKGGGPRTVEQDIKYMGGLQRIQYIFVYPEDRDIVLAGPGEGWKIDENNNVVGKTTGQPVLHLTDFIEALRSIMGPNAQPMTCSIDPTREGQLNLNKVVAALQQESKRDRSPNPKAVSKRIEEALGMQAVTYTGVDPSSSFALTMVAADYQMKRLAMGFEESPVRGMKSYLDLIGSRVPKNMMPRWWLEPDYDALLTDGNGLAWELRGRGVKCMTEDELLNSDGTRKSTGKVNSTAKKWADSMTANYDELCGHYTSLAHLRNCMDLAVVAALISSEDLHTKAGLELDHFKGGDGLEVLIDPENTTVHKLPVPKMIPSQVSYRATRRGLVLTASGGVSINPWAIVKKREKTDKLSGPRDDAIAPAGAAWCWN
jgi:hypothetical protein